MDAKADIRVGVLGCGMISADHFRAWAGCRGASVVAVCDPNRGRVEGMAGEWGRSGVRVNAVSPGFVAVPRMVDNIKVGTRYAVSPAEVSALGRLVEPEEVAAVIAFLLSDAASAVTGANLAVDAGVLAVNGWAVHGGVPPARPILP